VPYAISSDFVEPLPIGGDENEDEEDEEEEDDDEEDAGAEEEGRGRGRRKREEVKRPIVAGAVCADSFESYDEVGGRRELLPELLPLFRSAALVLGTREREGGREGGRGRKGGREAGRERESCCMSSCRSFVVLLSSWVRERGREGEGEQERVIDWIRLAGSYLIR
jgi:hypothetical protein